MFWGIFRKLRKSPKILRNIHVFIGKHFCQHHISKRCPELVSVIEKTRVGIYFSVREVPKAANFLKRRFKGVKLFSVYRRILINIARRKNYKKLYFFFFAGFLNEFNSVYELFYISFVFFYRFFKCIRVKRFIFGFTAYAVCVVITSVYASGGIIRHCIRTFEHISTHIIRAYRQKQRFYACLVGKVLKSIQYFVRIIAVGTHIIPLSAKVLRQEKRIIGACRKRADNKAVKALLRSPYIVSLFRSVF